MLREYSVHSMMVAAGRILAFAALLIGCRLYMVFYESHNAYNDGLTSGTIPYPKHKNLVTPMTQLKYRDENNVDVMTSSRNIPARNASTDVEQALKQGKRQRINSNSSPHHESNMAFVLETIQGLNISERGKRDMKQMMIAANDEAKDTLKWLAAETGSDELKTLSEQYQQRLPAVIGIGCKKCGSTFFKRVLSQHSRLAMRDGEAHYFGQASASETLETYRKMMKYSFPDQLTMEKTPRYWIIPDAPRLIYDMNPHIKLVLIVRDPACRIVSDYFFRVRNGWNSSLTLNDLATEPRHASEFEELREVSLYDLHMQNWLTTFPPQQIHIIRNEDLTTPRVSEVLRNVEDFLGVEHELEVGYASNNQEVYIRGRYLSPPAQPLCYELDENGACRYEEEFGPLLKVLRKNLTSHVSNFEKMVGRKFHWLD